MPKTRKFIDRKHAVTFRLVHRSQQDPLAADERAPQHVLVPVRGKSGVDIKKQRDEQAKYGIFFDDDYNYLQHLRDANKVQVEWEQVERIEAPPKLKLPSSVFASNVEEDVGLLNKAAPQSGLRLDLDPDIVAAMDEDFDYDDPGNQLEDNFVELANVEVFESSDIDSNVGSDFCDSGEEKDEVASLNGGQFTFADEETKSRFTEYSMSSSIIRRNDQLTLLDDRFEKMYSAYDENEIGALDCEEIDGYVDTNSELLIECADEFERDRKREQIEKDEANTKLRLQEEESTDDDNENDLIAIEVKDNKEKWDCESILSTYSNIYNHPKLISEPRNNQKIKINKKTGMPLNILGANKLTAKTLSQFDDENNQKDSEMNGPKSVCAKSIISALSTLSIRPKDETPDQRRERKQNLKEYRKVRRIEKKTNTVAFKEESKRQNKIAINNKNNVQGNRIL